MTESARSSQPEEGSGDDGIISLRSILIGPEQRRLAALQARLDDEERRAEQIKSLIDGGLTNRILVAHDVCTQPQLKKNGGGGFVFTSNLVVPALKALGVSDEVIRRIMIENPRRVLTFVAPQPLIPRK
jgi:phosphotriesterase-related protein